MAPAACRCRNSCGCKTSRKYLKDIVNLGLLNWIQTSKEFRTIKLLQKFLTIKNKKAGLSQRWPRNAPYKAYMGALKIFGTPDNAHGYYSQHFSWVCVRIDPVNVSTKFEVRSFTRSWDNRGYPKNLGTPRIRPRSIFSEIFNKLLFGLSL